MYFPLFVGALCLSCFVMHYFVSILCPFLFCNHLEGEEKTGCFAFIVLQMYCYYYCFVALPRSALGWSAVCDCGIT